MEFMDITAIGTLFTRFDPSAAPTATPSISRNPDPSPAFAKAFPTTDVRPASSAPRTTTKSPITSAKSPHEISLDTARNDTHPNMHAAKTTTAPPTRAMRPIGTPRIGAAKNATRTPTTPPAASLKNAGFSASKKRSSEYPPTRSPRKRTRKTRRFAATAKVAGRNMTTPKRMKFMSKALYARRFVRFDTGRKRDAVFAVYVHAKTNGSGRSRSRTTILYTIGVRTMAVASRERTAVTTVPTRKTIT